MIEHSSQRLGGGSRPQLRVAESIAAELRERILSGTLPGGTLPNQAHLVADFQASPPSVREALRILEVEGLITVRRGKFGGADIHRPNAASAAYAIGLALQGQHIPLEDLAAALLELEPLCAVSTAERKDRRKTVVPELRRSLQECEQVLGNGVEFTHRARRFHAIVVSHTKVATIRLVVRSLVAVWSTQEETWASSVEAEGRYPDLQEQHHVLKVHGRIADGIADGDTELVHRLSRRHLEATQQLVLARFGNRVVDAASPLAARGFRNLAAESSNGS